MMGNDDRDCPQRLKAIQIDDNGEVEIMADISIKDIIEVVGIFRRCLQKI